MRRALVVAVAISASVVRSPAQQPQPAGTAQVSGAVVTTDATPGPVRRAIVTLRDEASFTRSEVSDEQGRFAFRALPAGRFTLTATRPGFVAATYGARRPGRPGAPLSLAAGQSLADVRLHMARGGAIGGTVRDPAGRPAANVEILVRPAGRDILPGFPARGPDQIVTDDRGMYRAYGLEPGAYVVAAVPQLGYGSTALVAMTPAEIDAALGDLQQPPAQPSSATDQRARPRRVYTPVFYPGAASPSEAAAVTVRVGEEVSGIDVQLTLVTAVDVEGRIQRPDGAPAAGAQIIISGTGGRMPISYAFAPVLTTRPGADGRFRYSSVAPGTYTLTARTDDQLFAVTQLMVGGDDVTGVTLVLQPGFTFSGQIRFDASTLTPPKDLRGRIGLYPPGTSGGGIAVANSTYLGVRPSSSIEIGSEGRFTIGGVLPGLYTLTMPTPSGWWLRSATVDGRDLLDEPLTISGDVSSVDLTLTDRRSELSGVLATPTSTPAVEFIIVVFSADRRHWFAGSRRTRSARPGTDGQYVVPDLPAGEYLVAALDDLDASQLGDPAFLETLRTAAASVSIAEGGKARLDLKLAR
jgi:hypothetical protein